MAGRFTFGSLNRKHLPMCWQEKIKKKKELLIDLLMILLLLAAFFLLALIF